MKNEMLNQLLRDVGDLKDSLESINNEINESVLSTNRKLDDCYDAIEHLPICFETMEIATILKDVFTELGIKSASGLSLSNMLDFSNCSYSLEKQKASYKDIMNGLLSWKNGENYNE